MKCDLSFKQQSQENLMTTILTMGFFLFYFDHIFRRTIPLHL